MLYDDKEYDVKLGGPSSKVVKLIRRASAAEKNGASHEEDDTDDIYAELLPLLVISIDGVPVQEADGELQWAALFAGMKNFSKISEKKSARKKAGRR